MHFPFLKNKLGVFYLIFAILCFSVMNGVTRYLSEYYSVITLNMFRYWFFALFLVSFYSNKNQSVIIVSKSKKKLIQVLRGSMLAIQMCFAHYCFLKLGLVTTSSIFAIGPLIVTALSVLFLNENVGWRRWTAIVFGFIGILIILRPGFVAFDPLLILALGCAFSYALYQVLTRFVSGFDSSNTSFLFTGFSGAFVLTVVGPFFSQDIKLFDWFGILVICILGTTAHYFVIKAYKISQASILQPFNYLQLVFVSIIGIFIFDEILEIPTLIGSIIIVSAGLYTFWRDKEEKIDHF